VNATSHAADTGQFAHLHDPDNITQDADTSVLLEAHRLVTGARNHTYGPPEHDYARVAEITAAALSTDWTPADAVVQMLAVKLARIGHGVTHHLPPAQVRDSIVDLCGYAHCLWQILNQPTPEDR
jgi:hypothetical protein